MGNSGTIIALLLFAIILLIVITIAAAIGASNARKSKYYDTDSRIRTAYTCLWVTALISGIIILILIGILLYIIFGKPFSELELSAAFLNNNYPSSKDVALAVLSEKKLEAGQTTSTLIFIGLIFLTILVVIAGIVCGVAAFNLSQVLTRDQPAIDAENAAFIATLAGIFSIFIIFVLVILYMGKRSEANSDLDKLDSVIEKAKSYRGTVYSDNAAVYNATYNPFVDTPASAPPMTPASSPVKKATPSKAVTKTTTTKNAANEEVLCATYPFC